MTTHDPTIHACIDLIVEHIMHALNAHSIFNKQFSKPIYNTAVCVHKIVTRIWYIYNTSVGYCVHKIVTRFIVVNTIYSQLEDLFPNHDCHQAAPVLCDHTPYQEG